MLSNISIPISAREGKRMKCDKCSSRAIIFQKYSGMHLCKDHFCEDVERKVKRRMRLGKMVMKHDHVLIGLSGGKDSVVLLHLLKSIFEDRPDLKFTALTIDEGIASYRPKTLEIAKQVTQELGIEHEILSFKEEFGVTLDEIMEEKEEKRDVAACTYCGVFRKVLLNKYANQIHATKVATGHNLDDEAQAVLMNYLKGDIERLARLRPAKIQPNLVPRIKPLQDVPEKEVALYAIVKGMRISLEECPYAQLSFRAEIRDILNEFEVKHPGTKYGVMAGFEKIQPALKNLYKQIELFSCENCGEPTTNKLCRACKYLKQVLNK
ncbi:MAG: TIGR00269 family protein [Methanocellales archaeon]